jgi:hypothetical protein
LLNEKPKKAGQAAQKNLTGKMNELNPFGYLPSGAEGPLQNEKE